ncbi:MAG: hypothetical protein R3A79_21750 [Nannocystaceae bacterium]
MRQKTSSFRSTVRKLAGSSDSGVASMTESERFLRAAEQAFNSEDSQRIAAQEVLDRLIPSADG